MTHIKITNPNLPLIVLLGPTASGKTKLAVELARFFNGEIISADSRQVYRGMDLGTGKDLHEYGDIPYHLIDLVDPGHEYNLFQFTNDLSASLAQIRQRNSLPFLVGGTGLYLDAVLNRYQLTIATAHQTGGDGLESMTDQQLIEQLLALKPDQHNTTDLKDRKRLIRALEIAQAELDRQATFVWPVFNPLILGIKLPLEQTKLRITQRLKQRLKEGMIEEVEQLHQQGVSWQQLDFYGLEYRFVARYLNGELNYNDMVQKLNSEIHRFAKQQEKWFRRMERNGHAIHWLLPDQQPVNSAKKIIEIFLKDRQGSLDKA